MTVPTPAAQQPINLRPLTIGEVIDAALKLVTRHAKTMFLIAAIVLVPVAVLQYFATRLTIGDPNDFPLPPTSDDPDLMFDYLAGTLGPFLAASIIAGIIAGLAQVLVQLGSFRAVADVYLGKQPEWRRSLSHGLRRLPRAIGVFLLAVVPLMVGFVLCLLPGVWLLTSWALVGPIMALEDQGPAGVLGRSFQMVKKRFWPVLGVLALAFLITLVLQAVIGGALGAATLMGQLPSLELQSATSLLANLIVIPFTAAVLAVLYFDLRVRQEGFDLQLMAQAVASAAPADSPPPPSNDHPFGLDQPQ